jgi:mannose-6-phosphate isomerase-like protein (cupin superfamily)
MDKPNIVNVHECPECKIPKGWGHEIIIINDPLYCGKVLVFKKGAKFSMHYHMIKDETWYVNSGELNEVTLKVGDTVRQLPGQPHQLEALTDGEVFEVSTQHFDSDSYRVWKGDSQK